MPEGDGAMSVCTAGKPSPEGYLKAAKSLGIEPGHCLVIEDSLNGVQAAKRAGMRCTAVPTLAKSEAKYEEAGADEVLHTTLDFKPERWGMQMPVPLTLVPYAVVCWMLLMP